MRDEETECPIIVKYLLQFNMLRRCWIMQGIKRVYMGKKYWRILAEKEMFYVRLQEDMSRIRCCAGETGQTAK